METTRVEIPASQLGQETIKKPSLATDVGGVLKRHQEDHNAPPEWLPHAESSLKKLSEHYILYIISHVKEENEDRLRQNLRDSFVIDYIPEDRWFFVRERECKVEVMKMLDVRILIDDRTDIVEKVKETGFFGILFGCKKFHDWRVITKKLLDLVGCERAVESETSSCNGEENDDMGDPSELSDLETNSIQIEGLVDTVSELKLHIMELQDKVSALEHFCIGHLNKCIISPDSGDDESDHTQIDEEVNKELKPVKRNWFKLF